MCQRRKETRRKQLTARQFFCIYGKDIGQDAILTFFQYGCSKTAIAIFRLTGPVDNFLTWCNLQLMTSPNEAIPRAKRLQLLREAKARKERGEVEHSDEADASAAMQNPVVDKPMDVEVKKPHDHQQDTDVIDDEKANDLVEKVDQMQEENVKTEDESEEELLNLAPKRANWDMERDIAPMLRKLERRTQHAIVEILREKLAAEQQEQDSDDDEEDDEEEEIDA
ncbi:unnamed protein product [Peronospora belbahrii]|uniref:Cwf18 pre-mRNA splicing factor n=1 Tax=Peronospora belbahrii TaxID=622444 RepID=A0ABN8D3Y2_9STRA|nr:unnamed protein product [Peronospora belbahrii]